MITLIWIVVIASLIGFWVCSLTYEERIKTYNENGKKGLYGPMSFSQFCNATEKYFNRDRYLIAVIVCIIIFIICVFDLMRYYRVF